MYPYKRVNFREDRFKGVCSPNRWNITNLWFSSFLPFFLGVAYSNKKAVLSQRWPRNAPYIWVPWKLSGLPDYAHGHFSQHFHGLLFWSTLWMFLQNLKSVALSVPEIIGVPQKLGSPWIRPRSLFSKIFNGLYSDWPCKCTVKY